MNKLIKEISGQRVKKTSVSISKRDVEQVIATLCKLGSTWRPIKGPARPGDRLTLRYRATSHGRMLEEKWDSPIEIILGLQTLPRAIEQRLAGLRPDSILEHTVTRPVKSGNHTQRQRIHYTVQIIKTDRNTGPLSERQLARQFGINDRDPALLHRHVRQTIADRVELLVKQDLKQQLFDRLIAIDQEQTPHVATEKADNAGQTSLDSILREIIRSEGITLDFGRVENAIEALVSESPNPESDYRRYIDDTTRRSKIESAVLEDQVLEHLLKQVNVDTTNKDYKDFMAKSAVASDERRDVEKQWPSIQINPATKCGYCTNSKCCTYITQHLPTPRSKSDFSHLLWQVSHEKVRVFKDSEGWSLLIDNPCSHLQPDGCCAIYESRPDICRNYSNEYCEFEGPAEEGYDLLFNTYEDLLAYCQKRFKRWSNYASGDHD